jgi:hypothetical protein
MYYWDAFRRNLEENRGLYAGGMADGACNLRPSEALSRNLRQ